MPHTDAHPDLQRSPADGDDELDLDLRVVETGPAADALLGDTDDGCDTKRGSDC